MPTEPRKLLVCVKRVADYDAPVRVRADGSAVVTEGVRTSLNPFDEIALEEALRIRERGDADEVVVCSVGPLDWQHQLRTALAMGADRAVLVATKDEALEPLAVARVLRAVVAREAPRLVLLGKQAVDGDDNQVGQMLAALWDRPQATFASALRIDGSRAIVDREVDTGIETIEVDLPAVVTADLRLNQPRYVKLPEMLKAKRKPIDVVFLAELGVDTTPQFRTLRYETPERRRRGRIVASPAELIDALIERGVLR